jgi:Zn-dependent protease/CBS domain-containing protein
MAAPQRLTEGATMGWSWRIGRVAGIGIYVHLTFLILLAWVALSHFMATGSVEQALRGMAFIILLFAIVVLHELGHALTAKRFGIRTRDITLLPIGGVARLERMPDDPMQELLVALAGPAVNIVLAAALGAVLLASGGIESYANVMRVGGSLLDQLFWVNVTLAVFNLLPAFPMDGGRVLRALLAMRMDYVHATQYAARMGQAMALLFGFLGLFANPFLVFIALFVWLGAAEEAAMVQMRSALDGIPVIRAAITNFQTVRSHDSLARVVDHILAGFQQDFPVVDDGHVVGVLTRSDLLAALARSRQETAVEEVMQREFETADPLEMLEPALARLRRCNCHTLPVVREGRLVGLLTMDNLSEFLMIRQALEPHHQTG